MNAEDPDILFDFFGTVSVDAKDYFCDFYSTRYADGTTGYKVLMKSFDNSEIVVDFRKKGMEWEPIHTGIPQTVIHKLIVLIKANN